MLLKVIDAANDKTSFHEADSMCGRMCAEWIIFEKEVKQANRANRLSGRVGTLVGRKDHAKDHFLAVLNENR